MSSTRFSGPYAAMITPFTEDGALSKERLERYCAFLIEKGVSGLFAFGTTGEWPLLSEQERREGTEALLRCVRGKVPVIIHAGANDTEQAIRLSLHAREAGASAVSLISPPFYPLDEQALFDHFTAVARSVEGFPVFLYNIPDYAGNDISPGLLARVAQKAGNVIGLKYSGGSLVRFREYRRAMGEEFNLFNGNDSLALPALYEGADGLVSGNASCVPELLVELYARFRRQEHREAHAKQLALDAFIAARDGSCELSTFKAILAHRGVPAGEVRRPLKRLGEQGREAVRRLVP